MDKPWISPAESLVIGLCVGETVEHHYSKVSEGEHYPLRITPPEYTLNGLLKSRLRAYFPQLQPQAWRPVEGEQKPGEVLWRPVSQARPPHAHKLWQPNSRGEIGVAEGQPRTVFLREKGDIQCVTFDITRHGLLDQLYLRVGHAMWLPPLERFLFALETSSYHLGDWNRVVATFRDASPILEAFVDGGIDDAQKIVAELRDVMDYNECSPQFDLGRRFGEAFWQLSDIAASFLDGPEVDPDWTMPTESDFAPFTREVNSLLQAPIVRRIEAARNLLQQLCKLVPFNPYREYDLFRQEIDSHRLLWLAFGEVLAVLRDADLRTTDQDARVVDRAFRVMDADTPDALERKVQEAERAMSESPDVTASDFIVALSPAIEALTKRLWSSDFGGPARLGVGQVLGSRLQQSRSEIEKRFASIARTLYHSYRNQVQHETDAFDCSLQEARFFIYGIRTLLELARQIQASRPT